MRQSSHPMPLNLITGAGAMAPVPNFPGASHAQFKPTILGEGPAASRPHHLAWAEIMDTGVIQVVYTGLSYCSYMTSSWWPCLLYPGPFWETGLFPSVYLQVLLSRVLRLWNSSHKAKCLTSAQCSRDRWPKENKEKQTTPNTVQKCHRKRNLPNILMNSSSTFYA
jgi:hypothetical protein